NVIIIISNAAVIDDTIDRINNNFGDKSVVQVTNAKQAQGMTSLFTSNEKYIITSVPDAKSMKSILNRFEIFSKLNLVVIVGSLTSDLLALANNLRNVGTVASMAALSLIQ
ncbi:MAG TPA: hypothetical protein VH414_18675, partial [Lichenihabitans sp.]|nr:hypothetical protein [Lichenihabitans sp.]